VPKTKKHTVEFTTDELEFLEDRMWFLQYHFGPPRKDDQTPRPFEQDEEVYVKATTLREKIQLFLTGKGK